MIPTKEDLIELWNAAITRHPLLKFPMLTNDDNVSISYVSERDFVEVTEGDRSWRLSGQLLRSQ